MSSAAIQIECSNSGHNVLSQKSLPNNHMDQSKKTRQKETSPVRSISNPSVHRMTGSFLCNRRKKKAPTTPISTEPNDNLTLPDSELELQFIPVDAEWQERKITVFGLINSDIQQHHSNSQTCVPLTNPRIKHNRIIEPDGNCYFNAISYALTGCEDFDKPIRKELTSRMKTDSDLKDYLSTFGCIDNDAQYEKHIKRVSKMSEEAEEIDIFATAYYLRTTIYVFDGTIEKWQPHWPRTDSTKIKRFAKSKSIYLYNPGIHFDYVTMVDKSS